MNSTLDLSRHLDWSEAHSTTYEGKKFLEVASLYQAHPDAPTLALLQSAASRVEAAMLRVEVSE